MRNIPQIGHHGMQVEAKEAPMNSLRVCLWGSMTCILLAAPMAPALAETGLRISTDTALEQVKWPHWQARFGLATTASALEGNLRWQLSAGQLLGDYYWSGLRPAGVSRTGGFRATSGLLLGPRSLALSTPALTSGQGFGLTQSRSLRLVSGAHEVSAEPWSATPYVGVGYSGVSLRGGWGFTADLGLAGTTGGLRTRRDSALGTQGMDDLLRELRLTPVLQFGATYTF